MQVAMFYDGACPLCSREVAHYKAIDTQHRVRWVDISASPEVLEEIDVDVNAAMRRLQVLDCDGQVRIGAHAFVTLWAELPAYRWLAKLLALPGILAMADFAYKRFADWRFHRRSVECVRAVQGCCGSKQQE